METGYPLSGLRGREDIVAPVNPESKKQQFGDAGKTPEAGRNGRQKGRFFSSRPVTCCILVISRQIAFIHLLIFDLRPEKITNQG